MKRNKRTSRLSVRLTPEEYKHFLAMQRSSNLSQADFLMHAIDGMPMPDGRLYSKYKEIEERIDELRILLKNLNPEQSAR